jgi:hypothetical protein
MALLTPWFWTSSLQICEGSFHCLKHLTVVLCYGNPENLKETISALPFSNCVLSTEDRKLCWKWLKLKKKKRNLLTQRVGGSRHAWVQEFKWF